MGGQIALGKVLNRFSFTSKDVAEFANVSESLIKKIRMGQTQGSLDVQRKIREFIVMKIQLVESEIKNHQAPTLFDDV